ncbi:RHS repeat-associated core domain-containing protein, partial [Vibrio vulnificus]
ANIVQHSQKTADGSVIQEIEYLYEPETFRPLAQVTHKADQASQLHYIVTDHAGTPQELCSENGDVVWQGEQALWGHYQQKNALPNHGFRENAHNDELYCDLRYQGQIEDRESGLYYNVNRYYDADSGQYLSPDPIGFAGGLRPQAYVFNPLDWVDPLGLAGEAHEGKGEGTTRVRHYTNRKGSKAIEQDGVIKAQDNNRVYVEPANKKALSQVSAEDKYQIKRGKGRDYVETDVPDSQLEWVKNPRYGTPELTVKGDLLLKNAKFFRRK